MSAEKITTSVKKDYKIITFFPNCSYTSVCDIKSQASGPTSRSRSFFVFRATEFFIDTRRSYIDINKINCNDASLGYVKTTRPYKLLQRFFPLPKICLGAAPTFQCLNLMYTDRFSRISEQLRRRRERERERERQEREKKKQSWPVRVRDHSLVLLGCREFLCVCVCVCQFKSSVLRSNFKTSCCERPQNRNWSHSRNDV